jgi:hypothetical protein
MCSCSRAIADVANHYLVAITVAEERTLDEMHLLKVTHLSFIHNSLIRPSHMAPLKPRGRACKPNMYLEQGDTGYFGEQHSLITNTLFGLTYSLLDLG